MIEKLAKCGHVILIDDDAIRQIKSRRARKTEWQPQFCSECRLDFFAEKTFATCEEHDYQCQH